MSFNNRGGSTDLNAFRASDGAETFHDVVLGTLALLAADTTYYIPLGGTHSPVGSETALVSVHLKWSAGLAATITLETSNFPLRRGGSDTGPNDITSYDTTVGNWIQENPSTALVSVVGSGNSATALTITAGGTAAGGATIHLGNIGTRRARLKVAITVNGTLRAATWGKVG